MLWKIFLICFIQQVFPASQLKDINQRLHVYSERIRNINYTQYTFQQLTLTYDSYPEVFSQRLYKLVNQSHNITSDKMSAFEEVQIQRDDGCFSYQREIKTGDAEILELPLFGEVTYTDLIAVPKHLKAFLVRSDFTIIQADIQVDKSQAVYLTPENEVLQLNQVLDVQEKYKGNPQLLYDETSDKVFLFTPQGAVSFNIANNTNDTKFEPQTAFIKRQNIYEIHYDDTKKKVYVVAGADGVDVYQIDQGQLNYLVTIIDRSHQNFKIVDVATSGKLLFVLDEQHGFYTVDVSDIKNYFQTGFKIEIGHGRSFDFHQNTFIFIATSIHKQDYAIEIFIDIQSDSYYVNRFYLDEMQLYDVVVFDFYAILIGYDAHKLIYHSVFNGFEGSFMKNYIFSQPDLMKVVQFKVDDKKRTHQILGLGKSQLLTFQVQYTHPRVKCRSTQPIYEVSFNSFDIFLKTYLLKMNSTNCNTKQGNRDLSQYSQCQIDHQFNFITKQVFILFQEYFKPFLLGIYKPQIIVGVVIITLLILILTWCLYACWRKWGRVLDLLDRQVVQLKQQEKYGEQHNIQGEEGEQNTNQGDMEKQQNEEFNQIKQEE